jgi:hypothetical protein
VTHGVSFLQFLGKLNIPLASSIIDAGGTISGDIENFSVTSKITSMQCTLDISVGPTNESSFAGHSKGNISSSFDVYLYTGE